MDHFSKNAGSVSALVMQYFEGIYNGDIEKLEGVFHPQALVVGDVKGVEYFKTVGQYIEGVKSRKNPKEVGETFKMEIVSIEIINQTAIVKARVPIFGYNYYDLLSLAMVDGKWIIVNKLLTHVND